VTEDQELLMVIKTTTGRIKEVEQAVRSLHNYETPELIGFPLSYGMSEYLKWVEASTQDEES
jgi:periplasmic divalent cation tolerance protein